MITVMRGTRATVTDTYLDTEPLVRSIAERFARKYCLDMEEVKAAANFHFLEAYHKYDRTKNPNFGARVQVVVYRRLLDQFLNDTGQRRKYNLTQTAVDPDTCSRDGPARYFDREGLLESVGDDARTVLSLILESPRELMDAIRSDPNPGDAAVRRCLRRYLEGIGWAWNRIAESFNEIRGALA